MSQEYNLAGKTIVVDRIKQLKTSQTGNKSNYIRVVTKTTQAGKEAEKAEIMAGRQFRIQASSTMIERDDTRRDSQNINLSAIITYYDDPQPRFEINGLPRMCAYHTGDTKTTLIADLEDLIENQTSFTPTYSGTNNWSRGGGLFEIGETASVVYLCSDGTYVTAIMDVTSVGSSSITGTVTEYRECAVGFDDRDTDNVILYIPYAQAVPLDIVLYDNNDPKDTLRLEVQNVTRHRQTFGVSSTEKGSTYTDTGVEYNYIEGDSFVQVSISGDTKTAAVKFRYQNNWIDISTFTSYSRYDEILTDSLPDVFSIYQGENHVIASGYDWFKQVIAEHISAVYYFVGGAIYGYGLNGSVDMTKPVGQRAQGDAFIIDANGIIEISSGYARNLNIRGMLNLYDETGTGAAAEIQHPALTTVPEQGGDEIGKTLPAPTAWNIKEFYNNTNIPENSYLNDISSASFGITTLSAACRLTDLSAAAVPAASSSKSNISGNSWTTLMTVVIPPYVSSVTFTVKGSAARYTFFQGGTGGYEYRAVDGICYHRTGSSTSTATIVVQPQAVRASAGYYPSYSINTTITLGPGSWTIRVYPYQYASGSYVSTTPFPGSLTCSNSAVLFSSTSLNSVGFWVSNDSETWSNLGTVTYYSKTTEILSFIRNNVTFESSIFYSSIAVLKNYSDFYGKTDDITAEETKYYYEDSSGSNPVLGSNVSQYFPYQDSEQSLMYYEKYEVGYDKIYRIEPINVLINGVQFTATYFSRQSSSITIHTATGESFSFPDYIWMTLTDGTTMPTIRISGSKAGVEMMGNYPKEDMVYNTGSPDRVWLTGYIADVRGHSKRDTKEDIKDYERDALPILNATNIVRFVYKADKTKTPRIGFIADDTDSDLAGIKHDSFITNHVAALCIKAIQELSAEIEKLKTESKNN